MGESALGLWANLLCERPHDPLGGAPGVATNLSSDMYFHSLDYGIFLGIAVMAFWGLTAVGNRGLQRSSALLWLGGLLARVGAPMRILRLGTLFTLSCAFYMAWRAEYIALILGSTVLDYAVGHAIHRSEDTGARKRWLALSLAGNLGLLFTFKYYNFFAAEITAGMHSMGWDAAAPLLGAALPVGISFYTFQTLSYTIDIYRGKLKPARDFITFACFVTYFPQLVAGPIVRASELLPQLEREPTLRKEQVSNGLFLIVTGLVKKLAIADFLALGIVDRVFSNPDMFTASETVFALYAFTMQLYCDFSGYTDVARGSAKLMGLELPENFDRPYSSTSPAEFWRRWHMTLSRWLRDYLYFPLGGSRVGPVRAYFNLFVTMFLVGIWHGWWQNFVVFFWYALLQAGVMCLHRLWHRWRAKPKDHVDTWHVHAFKVFLSLQFVVFSRILFRSGSMENAEGVARRVLSGTFSTLQISLELWLVLVGTFVLHFTPRRWFDSVRVLFVKMPAPAQAVAIAVTLAILSLVAAAEAVPYIYFQF